MKKIWLIIVVLHVLVFIIPPTYSMSLIFDQRMQTSFHAKSPLLTQDYLKYWGNRIDIFKETYPTEFNVLCEVVDSQTHEIDADQYPKLLSTLQTFGRGVFLASHQNVLHPHAVLAVHALYCNK